MKSIALAITAGLLSVALSAPSYALVAPGNVLCAAPHKPLKVRVSFDAAFENGVIITDSATGRVAMTFNNFYGRGAGREWRSGAGTWVSRPGRCYTVRAQHKTGPANPSLPWVESQYQRDGNKLGFEDGADNDYNDAVVRILR